MSAGRNAIKLAIEGMFVLLTLVACDERTRERGNPKSGRDLDGGDEIDPIFVKEWEDAGEGARDASSDSGLQGSICDRDGHGINCPCDTQNSCDDGLVCDDSPGTCRMPSPCEQVVCNAWEFCQPLPDGREVCLSQCEPGFLADEVERICKVRSDANCDIGAAGSIASSCELRNRVCDDKLVPVGCGDCFAGYVSVTGDCRTVTNCDALDCVNENRECIPAKLHEDAQCGKCLPGYVQKEGICEPDPNTTCNAGLKDLSDICEDRNRSCEDHPSSGGSVCGDCLAGYVQNSETDTCDPDDCVALNCSQKGRVCEQEPHARCGRCASGMIEDRATGECVPLMTCSDLDCPNISVCEPEFDGNPAYCLETHGCSETELWNPLQERCVTCPVCGDDEGESNRRWPVLTKGTNRCICATSPGYFFSDSTDLSIYPCDRDEDGWVRSDARGAMSKSADDPIRINARCNLRRIDRFVVINGKGESHTVQLNNGALLYEPTILDDDEMLQEESENEFGFHGRRAYAAELNPLTKACAHPSADFNQNGVFDVLETPPDEVYPGLWETPTHFMPMAYFVELYAGWYEEAGDEGVYVISDRRSMGSDNLSSPANGETTSDICPLLEKAQPANEDSDGPILTDGESDDDRIQTPTNSFLDLPFRCVVITDEVGNISIKGSRVSPSDIEFPCVLNQCFAKPETVLHPPGPNPWSPEMACKNLNISLDVGDEIAGWIVSFQ